MLRLKKIAITGGIATGKTSVCQYFQELGAYILNADAIVHELLTPNTNLGRKITRLLGPEIIEYGQFNRKAIAEKVFKDKTLLHQFEEVLHPLVLAKIKELYTLVCKEEKHTSFVVEMPLLFEIRAEKFYDATVAVVSDEKTARMRFEQSGFPKTEYNLRMNRQIKTETKAKKAQYIIQNNGSLEKLKQEVFQLNRIIQLQ